MSSGKWWPFCLDLNVVKSSRYDSYEVRAQVEKSTGSLNDSQWLDNITGYQRSTSSDGHQSDMPYCAKPEIKRVVGYIHV